MIFQETTISGPYLIELERQEDQRGFFARTWCQREFEAHGLNPRLVQCSISFNKRKGTLRGMHYQAPPHAETKLVRCTRGAIYDVIIDLRPNSPTFKQWAPFELTAENRRMIYVPKGFAHGFQTLADDTEVFYQMSEFYRPGSAVGIRWDDAAFSIDWPLPIAVITERDLQFAGFSP